MQQNKTEKSGVELIVAHFLSMEKSTATVQCGIMHLYVCDMRDTKIAFGSDREIDWRLEFLHDRKLLESTKLRTKNSNVDTFFHFFDFKFWVKKFNADVQSVDLITNVSIKCVHQKYSKVFILWHALAK